MADGDNRSGIDFVITWVDGADPAWRRERDAFTSDRDRFGHSEARFRDWGLLRYWFRGVERFAPWVDKVHFVTWGHLPPWLDGDHPKLHIVNHRDFIPAEYLPTFNTNTIELNLHRIPNLSEQFAYFNDDVFLLRKAEPSFFFRGGLPRDFFCLDAPGFATGRISHIIGEDLAVINDSFDAHEVYRRNGWKMLAPSLGCQRIRRNLAMRRLFRRFIPGFENRHSFLAFRTSTFVEVWSAVGDRLDATCRNRFRGRLDLSDWVMRYWQLARSEYFCGDPDEFACAHLTSENVDQWARCISQRGYSILCVNDNSLLADFDSAREKIAAAFASILPERCSFEKEGA